MFTVVLTVRRMAPETFETKWKGACHSVRFPFSRSLSHNHIGVKLPVRLRTVDCMQVRGCHWGILHSLPLTVMSNVMLFYAIKIPVFVYWMFACCFTDVFDLRHCCCCCRYCCFDFLFACLFRLFVVPKLRTRCYTHTHTMPSIQVIEGGYDWKMVDRYVDGGVRSAEIMQSGFVKNVCFLSPLLSCAAAVDFFYVPFGRSARAIQWISSITLRNAYLYIHLFIYLSISLSLCVCAR